MAGTERITLSQAAAIAGVCTKTMRSYAKENIVPGAAHYGGRVWRFDEAKLRRWIAQRETTGGGQRWRRSTGAAANGGDVSNVKAKTSGSPLRQRLSQLRAGA